MKIGFIGCGNMAQAMIGGIIKAGLVDSNEVIASDAYQPSLDGASEKYKIKVTKDNKEVASQAEMVVLAIKPQFYETIIKEISPVVKENTIIITIAPGQSLEKIEKQFGKEIKVVRTMPNTPAMVGEGMTALCANSFLNEEEKTKVKEMIGGFGKAEYVAEYMMDSVVAVSGSAPAYVFMFIEALADGAVLLGMGRKEAYTFAAQTVMGSAKMVLETGKHPAELKDMVCSPGGTTIEAVKTLEEEGFRSAVIKAMVACANKSRKM
ncbi:MAG: pyrroline-5-carboxylate reductase [Clostridium sp.]|nr:pyrroline-5-carboxylate reductase [Clostridium sp.]